MADIIDIDVFQTVTSVSFEVEPNTDIININKVTTSGYAGIPNLQEVTDEGSTTTNPITANSFIKSGGTGANVLLDNGTTTALTSIVGTTNLTYTSGVSNGIVNSNTGTDATIPLADSTNAGLFSATEKTKLSGIASGAEVNVNADWNATSGDAQILNKPTGLATTTYVDNKDNSQQLQLNYLDRDNSIFDAFYLRTITDGGTVEASNQLLSSLAVLRNISYVNQGYTQQINADKFVKLGGTSAQYLMADGSVTTGGGGGGGATNLAYTPSSTNGIVTSDTGTDATIPLADGTNAGLLTPAEKTKIANSVPYTGATTNVNLGEFGLTSGQVTLDTTPTGTTVVGTTQWNDSLGSSQTTLKGGTVVLKNGVDLVARIVNKVTPNQTLTKAAYQAVRVVGATGQRLSVELAQGDTDLNSADTIGLVTETIATNQEGFIITMGQIENINTTGSLQSETWVDGDVLYLSPTVAGRLTNIKPTGATGHIVVIGYVEYAHAINGKIYVKIMNGWELDELHNVYINNPLNNEGLFYETSTELWKNKSIATVLGYTPANDTSVVHLTGNETIAGVKTFSSNIVIPATGSALILSTSSGGTVSGLTTTTYPDLTELALLKGVTGSSVQTQLNGKVSTNTAITGATNTKITYDAKGLVTSGTTLIESDIPTLSQSKVTNLTTDLAGKQATLQSTVNIKSINGDSILGSGNLIVTASAATQSAYTILANNTASTAVPTEQVFKNEPSKAYTGTITPSATTAPTGTTNHTYSWCQVGDLVTIRLNLDYATAGATVTSLACMLPSDCPNPELPSGVSTALNVISYGVGTMAANKASVATMGTAALRLKTTAPNTFDIQIQRASGSYATAYATIQYFV